MNQAISDEIQKLFDVVSRQLETETPGPINLPLYSNELQDEEIEAIRSGLQAELESAINGRASDVTLGRVQDENEAGSLVVSFIGL